MLLKHIFLPTKQNHYHPHAIRWTGLSVVLLMILGANAIYNWQTAHTMRVLGYATSISSYEIVSLTNQERSSNGLPALNTDAQLTQAAQNKAADMFAKDYWAHTSPTGQQPWDFIAATGYDYETAGENLAKDFDTSASVVNAWMNSPEHRANILNATYKDVGVAVVNGTLQGSETTLVVAMYGSRATPPAPISAPAHAMPPATTNSAPRTESTPPPVKTAAPVGSDSPTAQQQTITAPAAKVLKETVGHPGSSPLTSNRQLADIQSVQVRQQLNWAQQVAVFLLSVILLVNVLKHTIVWRTQRRGWRHIWLRAHPAAQYLLIVSVLILTLFNAQGVIR